MKRRTFLQRLGLGMAAAMVNANVLLGQRPEPLAIKTAAEVVAQETIAGTQWLMRTLERAMFGPEVLPPPSADIQAVLEKYGLSP